MGLLGALPVKPGSSTILPAEVAPFPEGVNRWARRVQSAGAFAAEPPAVRVVAPLRAPRRPVRWRSSRSWPAAGFVQHVYFDRSGLPDLEPFIRFEPPTIGEVYDARGKVLIQLAREYRRVRLLRRGAAHPAPGHPGGRGQELPLPLRGGLRRAARGWSRRRRCSSLAAWWKGGTGFRLLLPPGRLDAHAAARPRLLPPAPDESRERRRPLPRRPDRRGSSPRSWVSRPRTSSSGSWRRCA